MQIEKHDESYIVKLKDGSSWRIWPGDIAKTLRWLPNHDFPSVSNRGRVLLTRSY